MNINSKMVLDKYRNIPPFTLRKNEELLREESCKSRKPKTKPVATKDCDEVPQKLNSKIIPKILENFRKATPNKDLEAKASIQTLYRNENVHHIGKSLPKHNLMKKLLKDLDRKPRKIFNKNESIRSEFEVRCLKADSKPRCSCCIPKMDKKTSTSDLPWHRPSKLQSRSFLEEKPCKDVPQARIPRPPPPPVRKNFVQHQVEKFNKGVRPPRAKREERRNYGELLEQLRCRCPHYQRDKSDSDHTWTDPSYEDIPQEYINFPKETKMAMDLQQNRPRVPLSKLCKIDTFRPAIEIPSDKGLSKKTKCQFQVRPSRMKTLLPCKRNLLCDKGEAHEGRCGYTHSNRHYYY